MAKTNPIGGSLRTKSNASSFLNQAVTTNIKSVDLTQPAWFIGEDRSAIYQRLGDKIGGYFQERMDIALLQIGEQSGADEQAAEDEKALEEGRPSGIVQPNGFFSIFNPDAAAAFRSASEARFLTSRSIQMQRNASEIATQISENDEIPVEERASEYGKQFDAAVLESLSNVPNGDILNQLTTQAENIRIRQDAQFNSEAVAVKRAEQLGALENELDQLSVDLLTAARSGDPASYTNSVEQVVNWIADLQSIEPTNAREVQLLDNLVEIGETQLIVGEIMNGMNGLSLAEKNTLLSDLMQGKLAINFTSPEQHLQVVNLVKAEIARDKAQLTIDKANVELEAFTASRSYQNGEAVEDVGAIIDRLDAHNADGSLDDVRDNLLLDIQLADRYVSLNNTDIATLVGLEQIWQQRIQERRPDPVDTRYLEGIRRQLTDRLTARARGDELRTNTVSNNQGSVDNPEQRQQDAIVTEQQTGYEVNTYTSDEINNISIEYNKEITNRNNILENIVQSTSPDRINRVIGRFTAINPDLALSLYYKTRTDNVSQSVYRLLTEGQQIEDSDASQAIMIEAEGRMLPYLTYDREGSVSAAYYRAAKDVYESLTVGETAFRPDQMDRAVRLVLGLDETNQIFNGQTIPPFESGMASRDMEIVWDSLTYNDFIAMNGGSQPVIADEEGIIGITSTELKSAELQYIKEGQYALVVNGQFVRRHDSNTLFIFDFINNSEVLKERMLDFTQTNNVNQRVPDREGISLPEEEELIVPETTSEGLTDQGTVNNNRVPSIEADVDPARLELEAAREQLRLQESTSIESRRLTQNVAKQQNTDIEEFNQKFTAFQTIFEGLALNNATGDDAASKALSQLTDIGRVSVFTQGEAELVKQANSTFDSIVRRIQNIGFSRTLSDEQRETIPVLTLELMEARLNLVEAEVISAKEALLEQGFDAAAINVIMSKTDVSISRARREFDEVSARLGITGPLSEDLSSKSLDELQTLIDENPSMGGVINQEIERRIQRQQPTPPTVGPLGVGPPVEPI